jgi:large conductance mechanosensitive channel
MKDMILEFREFLKEYKVIGLAVAFVIGLAATTLIKSLVDNIIMPLVTPFIPGGAWATATWVFWKFHIGWGAFLGALINFIIIAFAVFLIVKYVVREDKPKKK